MIIFYRQTICIQCHANPKLINCIIAVFPEDKFDFYMHIPQELRIRSRGTERHSASN